MWANAQLRAHGVGCRYSDLLWACRESSLATFIHNEVIMIAPETAKQRGQTMREIEQLVAARGYEPISVQDWWDELDLTPWASNSSGTRPPSLRHIFCVHPATRR